MCFWIIARFDVLDLKTMAISRFGEDHSQSHGPGGRFGTFVYWTTLPVRTILVVTRISPAQRKRFGTFIFIGSHLR